MKKQIIFFLLSIAIISSGCMGPLYYGYSIYTYSGIVQSYEYSGISMFEDSIIQAFCNENNLTQSYSHSSNKFGMGHYSFEFNNDSSNNPKGKIIEISINDVESIPTGSPHREPETVIVTNITVSYRYRTILPTENMDSSDISEAEELSEANFLQDIETNREMFAYIESLLFRIFGRDPDRIDHVERDYDIICVD